MKVSKGTQVDWAIALDNLSVGAFYLLNVLLRKDVHISDKQLMAQTGYGLSTHRKQKRELMDKNYLMLEQVDKGVYKYTVGSGVSDGN